MQSKSKQDAMNLGYLCALAAAIVMVVWSTYDQTEENQSKRKNLSITFSALALGAVVLVLGATGALQGSHGMVE